MTTTSADLWPPDLAKPPDRKAPGTILREAGAQLGQRTKNLVLGRVVPEARSSKAPRGALPSWAEGAVFRYSFCLVAPALDFYEFKLFSIEHGVDLYPVTLRPEPGGGGSKTARSEAQFMELLKKVFASGHTKRVIKSLLEQSQTVEV